MYRITEFFFCKSNRVFLHKADGKVAILAAELQSMELSNDLRGALLEIITA